MCTTLLHVLILSTTAAEHSWAPVIFISIIIIEKVIQYPAYYELGPIRHYVQIEIKTLESIKIDVIIVVIRRHVKHRLC